MNYIIILLAFFLSSCTEIMLGSHILKKGSISTACTTEGQPKVGNPYIVDGIRYEPQPTSWQYRERGIASWYGTDFHGKSTANGECYNMYAYTAAHKTLPLPTIARVTNLENNQSVIVKINDRGPFVRGRLIDLSYAAAQSLGLVGHGTAPVLVEAIGGPYHNPEGRLKINKQSITLGPRDRIAETLPTVVPTMAEEEELAPPSFTKQVVQKAKTLPPPPPPEQRPFTSNMPLAHTKVYVQIGAFAEKMRATNAATELKRATSQAEVAPMVTAAGESLFRVRTGPFSTLEQAEKMLQKLTQDGFPTAQIKVEK